MLTKTSICIRFYYRLYPHEEDLVNFSEDKDDIRKDFEEHMDELPENVLKDLDLLEEELAQGAIYMKQSKDLRITVEQVRKKSKPKYLSKNW